MRRAPGFEFGPLTESDVPSALRLEELIRWNQTQSDWRRVLALDARGCFGAFIAGQLIGTTTTATYAGQLAWIGMVLVHPDYRRRGVATRLMRMALDYSQGAGVTTIKLDATPEGRPVYESLGFVPESVVERWEGTARTSPSSGMSKLDERTLAEVLDLDRLAFGADRSRLLDFLVKDSCCQPLVMVEPMNGRSCGYVLARRGARAFYIGPLIAVDEQAALTLLDAMLDQLAGKRVYIDLNAGFPGGARALADRRFVKQRDLIRMRYGIESSAGTSNRVFASAGPELG